MKQIHKTFERAYKVGYQLWYHCNEDCDAYWEAYNTFGFYEVGSEFLNIQLKIKEFFQEKK